jgi:isoamyl acetate esterase
MEDRSLSALAGRRSVLCFGDSITQQAWNPASGGWVARVANEYARKADILNRGLSGWNSRQGVQALNYIFPRPAAGETSTKPFAVTTVFFGANDAADYHDALCQHVPLAEYQENIGVIVEAASKVSEVVVVFGPPPVEHLKWPDRSNEKARAYGSAAAEAVKTVRKKLGLPEIPEPPAAAASSSCTALSVDTSVGGAGASPKQDRQPVIVFADLFSLFMEHKKTSATTVGPPAEGSAEEPAWVELLSDGLHLSPLGNGIVFEAFMTAIRTYAPHLLPDSLPWDLPVWKELGNHSPSQIHDTLREHLASPKAIVRKPTDMVCCCGKH